MGWEMKKAFIILFAWFTIAMIAESCRSLHKHVSYCNAGPWYKVYQNEGGGETLVLHYFPKFYAIDNRMGYHALGRWRVSKDTMYMHTIYDIRDWGDSIRICPVVSDSNEFDWPKVFLIREKKLIEITDYQPHWQPLLDQYGLTKPDFEYPHEVYELKETSEP